MTLIGCIATYNEAGLVAGAIDSLWAIGCDRVLVVDGAWGDFDPGQPCLSSDGTREIALEHHAEVIEAPGRRWHDQPEARTTYLVGNPGDWYIVCDADERVRGTLPDLDGEQAAYLVELRGAVNRFSRMRLFRHSGQRLWYQYRHYNVYADGVLIEPTAIADTLWMDHITRDPQREALKEAWYDQQRRNERSRPMLKNIPANPLGPMRYIGPGWIPGIPAQDLSADEALKHHDELLTILASPRPIYERITPPAETPDKPTARRKTRKE